MTDCLDKKQSIKIECTFSQYAAMLRKNMRPSSIHRRDFWFKSRRTNTHWHTRIHTHTHTHTYTTHSHKQNTHIPAVPPPQQPPLPAVLPQQLQLPVPPRPPPSVAQQLLPAACILRLPPQCPNPRPEEWVCMQPCRKPDQ